jgi:zinc protease
MLVVILSSLLVLAHPHARGPAHPKAVDPWGARVTSLPNGLAVLLAPDSGAVAVDVGVWYRAGSGYEKPGRSGVARMFGRLMFGASAHHPSGDLARRLEAKGATFATIINPDYASFTETVPPGILDDALELEADRMQSLVITDAGFERERDLRAQEQEGGSGTFARGIEQLYATAFEGDSYGRPVGGLTEDLSRLTLQDVTAFYRSRFAPENATMIVVGRFDPITTLASIRRRFGSIPRGAPVTAKRSARVALAPVPPQRAEREAMIAAPVQDPVLIVGWRAPAYSDHDGLALEVLTRALTGGTSGYLDRRFARLGLGTRSGIDRSARASLLYCIVVPPKKADTTQVRQIVTDEIEHFATQPMEVADLERARHGLEVDFLLDWQRVHQRGQDLGAAQLMGGDFHGAWARLERLRSITVDDVRRAAQRTLSPENRSVVWVVPDQETHPGSSGSGGGR